VQFRFQHHVLDSDRRELKRGGELIALEPQVFDLLIYLVQHRDRVVSKDDLIASVWGGRIVSDSTLTSRINAARKAVGDSGDEQRVIRTTPKKGFRFVGEVTELAHAGEAAAQQAAPDLPHQEVHFCTAADGVRIAYAMAGQGEPLIKAANWLNHLEYDWQSPIWSHLFRALAATHRLIRYDERGNGLSDWDVADISFDAFVQDLESVIEATGLKRFALLGISQGAAVSIAYAVRYPERVSHLILLGGFARGRHKRDPEQFDIMTSLIRQGWGRENPASRQFFSSLFMPDASYEQWKSFNDLQRITTSPENAVRIMQATGVVDVTGLLQQVKVPTLVLHGRNDAAIPFEEGRILAAGIPGARFVALESRNHLILENEPAWSRLLEEVTTFLKS